MFIKKWPLQNSQGGDGGAGGGDGGTGGGVWYDGFKDESVKTWLKSYGDAYPDPEAVALKALNLEKFVGADKAGRGVIIPKSDAKPEEWQEFYKKVGGVPDSPDGYKGLDDVAKADPMMKKFLEHAHKSGIPPMFVESVVKWYSTESEAVKNGLVGDFAANAEKDVMALKQEWAGAEYDKNIDLGQRAAKQFIPHSSPEELRGFISRMESALGTKATLKFFAGIGAAVGEHEFVGGDGGAGGFSMTPEAARARISVLKSDPEFQAKFAKGGSESRAEWDRLHKIAYGS